MDFPTQVRISLFAIAPQTSLCLFLSFHTTRASLSLTLQLALLSQRRSLQALTWYNMRDFEAAEVAFEAMWKDDPYRVSDMDVYRYCTCYVMCINSEVFVRVSDMDVLDTQCTCIVSRRSLYAPLSVIWLLCLLS